MTDTKKQPAFGPGSSGACEALLYKFIGHHETETPEELTVERIAAASIGEGLAYLG